MSDPKITKKYRQQVFKAVQPELKRHRKAASPFGIAKWMVAAAGLCAVVLVTYNLDKIQPNQMESFNQEFAELNENDLEMLENLDVLEDAELFEAMSELKEEDLI